ncbi:MAG TPA: hypothetical protein VFW30_00045 [Bryocella sp.]|nr:hypothetical protein [Bryocella sp.]
MGIKLVPALLSAMLLTCTAVAQVQTYCSNIAGNIACTTYDQTTSSQSYCTSIGNNLTCTTYNDSYDTVQVQRNYAAGQVIGTVLGEIVVAAIQEYREHKRIRRTKHDEWAQFVQDTLASTELACEADPAKQGTTVVGCRTTILTFDQFLHAHQKDFVPDGRNVELLADALDKTAPADQSQWTEKTYEQAFQTINRKVLDKKIYLGLGASRQSW